MMTDQQRAKIALQAVQAAYSLRKENGQWKIDGLPKEYKLGTVYEDAKNSRVTAVLEPTVSGLDHVVASPGTEGLRDWTVNLSLAKQQVTASKFIEHMEKIFESTTDKGYNVTFAAHSQSNVSQTAMALGLAKLTGPGVQISVIGFNPLGAKEALKEIYTESEIKEYLSRVTIKNHVIAGDIVSRIAPQVGETIVHEPSPDVLGKIDKVEKLAKAFLNRQAFSFGRSPAFDPDLTKAQIDLELSLHSLSAFGPEINAGQGLPGGKKKKLTYSGFLTGLSDLKATNFFSGFLLDIFDPNPEPVPLGAIMDPLAGVNLGEQKVNNSSGTDNKPGDPKGFASAIGGPVGLGHVAAARARLDAAKDRDPVNLLERTAQIRKALDIERRTRELEKNQAKRRAALAKASDGTGESRPSTPVTRTSPIGGPIGYGEEAAFKARQEALPELAAQVQANKNEAKKTASAKAGLNGRSLLDATGSTPGRGGGGGRDAPATSLLDGSAAANTARTGLPGERDRNKGGPKQGVDYGVGYGDPPGRFHAGGLVSDGDPGTFVSGLPVILQEGEFILSRAAVDALGAKTLERLNAVGQEKGGRQGKAEAAPIRAALEHTLGGGGPKSDRQLNDLLADRRYTRLGFPGQAEFAGRVAREFKLAYPGDAEGRPIAAEGGLVTDNDAATRRDDYATQAAEGTFVIARKAVDALGLNALARLNAAAIAGDRAALARLRHAFSELMV